MVNIRVYFVEMLGQCMESGVEQKGRNEGDTYAYITILQDYMWL